jgi:hypothetical protein
MFDANSRYVKCTVAEVETAQGKKVSVITLRRLPYSAGKLTQLKATDRLDIMAQRGYKDASKFWHIADANSALQANDLVAQKAPENPLAIQETSFIYVPEN